MNEPERVAEAIKDSSPRQEIRADPHLTGDTKENTILVLVEKFLGGPKNNQLLNTTVRFPPLDTDLAGQPGKPKLAELKQGLATADDVRFTRRFWELTPEGDSLVAETIRRFMLKLNGLVRRACSVRRTGLFD